jgi:hypothetical protein
VEHGYLGVDTRQASAGLTMREPSRKHGNYDRRWPAWSGHSAVPTPNGALAAWDGEGGSTDHEQGPVVDGLSWVMFSESFYPGRSKHSFPAISAWSRYRDGDRSWPQGARQRAPSARERSS